MSLFNESNLIDLAQRRPPFHDFLQRRLAQKGHAFVFRGLLDFGSGTSIENHAANTIGQVEKVRDRQAAVETSAVASETSGASPEGLAAKQGGIQSRLDQDS